MAYIPIQSKYPKRAGYTVLDSERNELVTKSDGIMKSVVNNYVNVKDFGAKGDGVTDDTIAFQNALNTGKDVFIPQGTFIVSNLEWNLYNNIFGSGNSTILKNIVPNSAIFIVKNDGLWTHKKITNLQLYGNKNLDNNGIEFYDHFGGRLVIDNIFFKYFNKAIFKNHGNIGNLISNCSFREANFHYYAQRDPDMQAGNDYFYNNHFSLAKLASIYFDNTPGGLAGLNLESCVIEANEGFGIFIKDFGDNGLVGTSLQSVHFELNATATSVTIDGTDYSPIDIYLENSSQVIAYNSFIRYLKLVNSNMITHSCTLHGNPKLINSRMINYDAYIVPSMGNPLVNSLADITLYSNNAGGILLPPRDQIVHSFSDKILVNKPFNTSTPWTLGSQTSIQIEDSINHTYSSEFTINPSSNIGLSAMTVTLNKYIVIVGNIKPFSESLSLNLTGTQQRDQIYYYDSILNQWSSFAFLLYNDGASYSLYAINNDDTLPITFRINDLQTLEFDTKPEALDFINSRMISDIVI